MAISPTIVRHVAVTGAVLQVIVPLFVVWLFGSSIVHTAGLLEDADRFIASEAGANELQSRMDERWELVYEARPALLVGLIGGLLAWIALARLGYHEAWFLRANRIYGWFWIPLIPVGTVMGVALLVARRRALNPIEESGTD